MFPMTDNVRQMFRNNAEIAKSMTDVAFDYQTQSVKMARQQSEKNVAAMADAFDTAHKATRAMQDAWFKGFMSQLEAKAEAA